MDRTPRSLAAWVAVALALAAGAAAVRFGVFAAAGADSYGYVSQSELWARGSLVTAQPIVARLPPGVTDEMLAPLGYRPARRIGVLAGIVPTYPSGLPMLMAALRLVAGPDGVFWVVPLLAALAVWGTFLFGRSVGGDGVGLASAALLASGPAFLASAVRPMSDLPAGAWWLLAAALALRAGTVSAAGAGVAAAIAVLTRPNLAGVGLVVALWFLAAAIRKGSSRSAAWRRLLAFSAAAAPGPLAVALIHNHLYDSPLQSGYGSFADLYAWSNGGINVERYSRWLVELQSPFIILALAGPLAGWALLRRRQTEHAGWSPASAAWLACAIVATICVSYAWYFTFTDWTYVRFLVPALPFALVLATSVVSLAAGRLRRGSQPIALALVVLVLVPWGIRTAAARGVFEWKDHAGRDVEIGCYLSEKLPENAVLLTMQLSGSARYYGRRLTIRYDFIPAGQLDELVRGLTARGFSPYFLLEEWEVPKVRTQFAAESTAGRLDFPPRAVSVSGWPVHLYDPADRGRPVAGSEIAPETMRCHRKAAAAR